MARFEENKALAVILYLAEKAGGKIDLYKLVKMAYFADKEHLHKWGRTITGDNYGKMPHGVTPLGVYAMIKSVRGDKEWPTDLSVHFKVIKKDLVVALHKPDLDELSTSDIEILDEIYSENKDKTFEELKMKAHDKAYNNADGFWMYDEDLAEGKPTLIDQIRYNQECDNFARMW